MLLVRLKMKDIDKKTNLNAEVTIVPINNKFKGNNQRSSFGFNFGSKLINFKEPKKRKIKTVTMD
jgi:hypothetical protein